MGKAKGNKKIFLLDTNVLLHDPNSLFRFQEHDVFFPFVTLEELDKFKIGTQDINRNARQATRLLEQVTTQANYTFSSGFPLKPFNGHHATGRLFMQHKAIEEHELALGTKNDNQFLAVLEFLTKTYPTRQCILITKDLNLRVKARALGFEANDYTHDHAVEDSDLLYRGYREAVIADLEQAGDKLLSWKEGAHSYYEIPQQKRNPYVANEMLVFPDGEMTVVKRTDGPRVTLATMTDYTHPRHSVWGITARNEEQALALHLLMDPDVDFVSLLGPAGTGKTLLTLAAALEQVIEQKRFGEIIFTRATVPLGEDIGFLPGTEEEKMGPWLGAMEDNLEVLMQNTRGENEWQASTTAGLIRSYIKVKSISFMRGRTFNQKFVILDEAQNLTPKQMKSLVTRAGEGTKIVVLGNLSQIDTPYLTEHSSGLAYGVERFKGWAHYGHVILEKGERSRLANYANEAL